MRLVRLRYSGLSIHPSATSAATNPPCSSPTTSPPPAKTCSPRYAERMSIENELDAYISGYHLDAISSGVPLNVDLDTTLTVVAGNLYRLFAATSPATKPPHPTPSGATSSTTTAPSTSPTTAWSARSGSAATTPNSSTPATPTPKPQSPGGATEPCNSPSHPDNPAARRTSTRLPHRESRLRECPPAPRSRGVLTGNKAGRGRRNTV